MSRISWEIKLKPGCFTFAHHFQKTSVFTAFETVILCLSGTGKATSLKRSEPRPVLSHDLHLFMAKTFYPSKPGNKVHRSVPPSFISLQYDKLEAQLHLRRRLCGCQAKVGGPTCQEKKTAAHHSYLLNCQSCRTCRATEGSCGSVRPSTEKGDQNGWNCKSEEGYQANFFKEVLQTHHVSQLRYLYEALLQHLS